METGKTFKNSSLWSLKRALNAYEKVHKKYCDENDFPKEINKNVLTQSFSDFLDEENLSVLKYYLSIRLYVTGNRGLDVPALYG